MFKFDLQLFGGGGGGKDGGKIIGSLLFGAASVAFGFFGAGLGNTARFLMGASLFSSVWTATHPVDLDTNTGDTSNIQRFDRQQETMSSTGSLPVVYGQRKLTGNQTFHDTNADANTLHKHVVLCEGGIEGIDSVCANDLLIPTGSQTSATVFTIQNVKYTDATVYKSGKTMTLYANGQSRALYLCNKDDGHNGETYWSWQTSVPGLISYINQLGEGWQCFPVATTSMYPGDISIANHVETRTTTEYEETGWWVLPGGGWTLADEATSKAHGFTRYYSGAWHDANGYILQVKTTTTTVESPSNCYRNPVNASASTVTGGTSFAFHDSTPPDNYATTGAYTDMAWLDMHFVVSNELNGNPSVSCVVRGKKVYDTRTKTTAYSTNPAMCLRDFMLSPRYGLGKWFASSDLDVYSWNEAADYCDEIITFHDSDGVTVQAKRYELNMVIDQQKSALEWLQQILANFAGFIVYSNGKLKLCIEKPTVTSYKFNDDNCSDLKIEPLHLDETPNRYEISLVDPLNNWSSIKAICEDYADQKLRQRIITKSVSLEGVTSQNQALRLARFYRDYNLTCPLQVSFSTGMQGMSLEPGDVVTLSYHGVFTDLPVRIASIKETNKGTFEISGRQYNATIYGDDLGGGVHWYNYAAMPSPYGGAVPEVISLTLDENGYVNSSGTFIDRVECSWTAPSYMWLTSYDVYYSYDGITYNFAGNTPDTKSILQNTLVNTTITVKVVVVNSVGRRSDGTTAALALTGKNEPPGDITDFVVAQYNDEIEFVMNGTLPDDTDIDHVELRLDGATWEEATYIADITTLPTRLRNVDISDGTHDFRVKAVDNVGNYSEYDAEFTLTVRNVNTFKNVVVDRDDVKTGEYTLTGLTKTTSGNIVDPWNMTWDDIWDDTFEKWWDSTAGSTDEPSILSSVIDTGRKGITGINYIFDCGLTYGDVTFGDIWDKTFGELWSNTFYNIVSASKAIVYIRFSNDGTTWTDWQLYLSATYDFRYIQYKLTFNKESDNVQINVTSLQQYYDVPDITYTHSGSTVDGVDTVTFDEEFYSTPTEISCVITGILAYPVVTVSKTGATVKTYNTSGTLVNTTYNLVVKGW